MFAITFCLFLTANAEPVVLQKGLSPDGRYYLTIETFEDAYTNQTNYLQIRAKRTGKILSSFDCEQFSEHITPDSSDVLWKSDSKALILSRMMARGFSGSEVYALAGSKWQLLEMPNKVQTKFSNHPEWHGNGKGWFVAVAWLSDGLLKADSTEPMLRSKADGSIEGDMSSYWIYYKLTSDKTGAHLSISKVEEKTELEKAREDQN